MSGNQFLGASHVARAQALLAKKDRKLVDYWWIFPPASADNVIATGGIALPAISLGVYSQVLQYNVPSGMVFVLTGVLFQASLVGSFNSAFAPASGAALGRLDVNQPVGGSVPVGVPVKGFSALTVPLGSFNDSPWPLAKAIVFDPLDELRWKVTNASLATGSVWVACGLFGYTVPIAEAS